VSRCDDSKSGRCLPHGNIKIFHCFLDVCGGLFNVVFHAVEYCTLIDNEDRQILEELGQGSDGLCNVSQLTIPGSKVWSQQVLCENLTSRLKSEG
jgi:hypothetical protein